MHKCFSCSFSPTHHYALKQLDDSALSQSHIERDYAKHIQDLAEKFAEEMEELQIAISETFCYAQDGIGEERIIKDLGSEQYRRELEEEVAEVEMKVKNAIKEFEVPNSCEIECGVEKLAACMDYCH